MGKQLILTCKLMDIIMNKKTIVISLLLISGLLIPITGLSHNYRQTSGYQHLLNWANQLRGISFNDHRYTSYCNRYAQISVAQANQRINQQCTQSIPTPNRNLVNRWSRNPGVHRNWCFTVSAHATRAESIRRESGLKNCMNRHDHRAQTRQACLANDTMHKRAARGDYNYVRKCLDAGVSANIREGNNWTPLHSAARNGRLNIVQLLLQRRAAVNARDVTGRTPMDQAKIGRYRATENYLERKGGVLSR